MIRRTLLFGLMIAAMATGAVAATPTPLILPPDDTYGFSSTLRAEGVGGPGTRDLSSWVKALKVLGETPMLTADAPVGGPAGGPVFRLTVLSAQRPAVTVRVAWSADRRTATAMISTGDGLGVPGARVKTVRRDFTGMAAAVLLGLADAREGFWDAAPLPPDWDAIQKLADCPGCPVVAPIGDEVLLEGRVGAWRHLIVRLNPQPGTSPARFQTMLLGPEKLPPAKVRPAKVRPAKHTPAKRKRRR